MIIVAANGDLYLRFVVAGMTLKLRVQEELFADSHRVLGVLDCVSDGAGVFIDLVVVAALGCLVSEEVDLFETLRLDVTQCVCLVPSCRKDIE